MIQRQTAILHHGCQAICLCHCARKPVEDHAIGAIRAVHTLGNHPENDVIRHQVTAIHDGFRLQPQFSPGRNCGAQHFTGRQLDKTPLFNKPRCLRTFTGTWRSKQNDVHLLRPRSLDFFTSPSY